MFSCLLGKPLWAKKQEKGGRRVCFANTHTHTHTHREANREEKAGNVFLIIKKENPQTGTECSSNLVRASILGIEGNGFDTHHSELK